MKLKKMHWFGIGAGVIVMLIDVTVFLIRDDYNIFMFFMGIGVVVVVLPFIVGLILQNSKEQKIAEMFLEFARNLAESVSTGTPVSKSIINMRKKNFGELSPFVIKMANQIELGISVDQALQNFAFDVQNPVISRAVSLISEAERAGGEIDYILKSVAESISEVEKLKKERKAAIYNIVVEGYIIFLLFIAILLVMEFRILPLTSGIGGVGIFGGDVSALERASDTEPTFTPEQLSRPFLFLLLAQGFFAGLTIGKLTEGTIRAGVKHSFALTVASFMISTGARLFIDPAAPI